LVDFSVPEIIDLLNKILGGKKIILGKKKKMSHWNTINVTVLSRNRSSSTEALEVETDETVGDTPFFKIVVENCGEKITNEDSC
jgi:hypothetical protein